MSQRTSSGTLAQRKLPAPSQPKAASPNITGQSKHRPMHCGIHHFANKHMAKRDPCRTDHCLHKAASLLLSSQKSNSYHERNEGQKGQEGHEPCPAPAPLNSSTASHSTTENVLLPNWPIQACVRLAGFITARG